MDLDTFEKLVRNRSSVRHFRSDPLPEGLLERLLEIAHRAPSGYNMQPTHFTVATDPALRERLYSACMNQAQIREAPAVVIFTGDRRAHLHQFERIVTMDREAQAISPEYEQLLRKVVPLTFGRGPLGLGWLWKRLLIPLVGLFRPVPGLPILEGRYWLAKQVMLTAMVFMLAARAAELGTCPMEGFDERRIRRILNIPRHHVIVLIVPVGYPAPGSSGKTRLPLEEILHRERW